MIFAILGSLGGVVAFLSAMVIVVRSIFRQISATETNTSALNDLKTTVAKLDADLADNSQRITRLEDRLTMRRGTPR